jgi:hypothetical protein
MRQEPSKTCNDCGGALQVAWIEQEYEREGLRVSVSGIRVLKCEQCGEVYFEPGASQSLVETVNCLFEFARKNRQTKGKLSAAV